MHLPAKVVGALLAVAVVASCASKPPASGEQGSTPVSIEFSKRKYPPRIPDPCNIGGKQLKEAKMTRDWKQPVKKEIAPAPGQLVTTVQCRYGDETNPNARVVIGFRPGSAQEYIDNHSAAGFEPIDMPGHHKAWLRFTPGVAVCGTVVDFKFGLMQITLLANNSPRCQRGIDMATVLEPWFATWEGSN